MKISFLRFVCCFIASMLLFSSMAKAQEIELFIDSVVVRSEQLSPTRSVMNNTLVFNRQNVLEAPIQTLESALRLSPSIDIRERGGKAIQTDISIRGGSFDQTQVMLNGVIFTDARTGHQSHSLPIDLDCIGSILLLDGVQGVGTYAGAINSRTTPLYDQYLRAHVAMGKYGYNYYNLSGAWTNDRLQLFAAGSYKKSDGYRENTDFDNINAFAMATYEAHNAGTFDIQVGVQNRSFGANGFYSLKYLNQFEHTETALSSLRWMLLKNGWEYNALVSWRVNTDRFELIKGNSDMVPFNYHFTNNLGAEAWIAKYWFIGKTTIGADWSSNRIWSTVLGDKLDDPRRIGKNDYTKSKDRNVVNFWLLNVKTWTKYSLGISAEASMTPYGTIGMGSGEFAFYPTKDLKLYAGLVQSMRLPTFTDLYYTSTGYVSNPDLKPEQAFTTRLGIKYNYDGFSVSAIGFWRKGKNLIDWVRKTVDDNWQSEQITQMDTFGAELSASWNSEFGFIRHADINYGYNFSNKDSEGYISKYALDYMRNKLSVGVITAPCKNVRLSLTGSCYDRNGNYSDKSDTIMQYSTYFLLDGKVSWTNKSLELYAEASNITSTDYFDYGGLPMPTIWPSVGLVFTLR